MRIFLAWVLGAAIFAGGAYSVIRSVADPAASGTYTAYMTGAASRIDWSDRANAGFDE